MEIEELIRLSNLSQKDWQKLRSSVVQEPPFDLKARESALHEAHAILTHMGVRYWLTGGSLLGAIRERDFIPWDDDVDMDMLEEEFKPVMHQLKEKLIAGGFVVRLTDSADFPKMSFFKYGQKIALGALRKAGEFRIRPDYKYLGKFFEAEQKIIFKSREFLVPSPPEEFLSWVYGDWKTPIRSNVVEDFCNPQHFRKKSFFKRGLNRLARFFGMGA